MMECLHDDGVFAGCCTSCMLNAETKIFFGEIEP